ncbi:uroporphyrinogen-III synthase [Chelativorans salis]|uniref:Uroporphyrinogen-III synthase n=1 Tax=Chelativorans salis TaxID=2978478 RepID=A0ABT2LRS3_9HYPH|nr:uroporphyrinogen-III synthase [Chelativorans sp. EGI FJ00035]MCT7377250.1 uroporphyrinogen-III synthase [Chelativorans sp. EGI FJ00035]
MRRVLVTRPEPGASRTAARLKARGFVPVVLPLTKIEPLRPGAWPAAAQSSAVAISSANAVRHAPADLVRDIAHLPAYAVGERTAGAAREAGLTVADAGAGDAERLVERIAGGVAPGGRVLVLAGLVRRETLEWGLSGAGFAVDVVETYETLPLSPSPGEIDAAFGAAPIDAALFYSAFAVEAFGRLHERASAGLFEGTVFIAISARVAERLPHVPRARVRVAAEPTEEAMFSLLEVGM